MIIKMGVCQSTEKSIFTSDINSIKRSTYEGEYKYCRMDDVYDGDTADIYFMDGGKIIRRTFRFYGYDSEEMKQPKLAPNRDRLKAAAEDDKAFLSSLVLEKKLVVHFMKPDKYGRLLGTVWKVTDVSIPENQLQNHPEAIDVNNICNIMIGTGHGKPYYGGHKE